MTTRTYAPWVQPIAAGLRDNRARVLAFAREAQPDFWDAASAAEEWTNKDVLAHVAGGNDRLVQTILRSVIARQPIDLSILQWDTNEENASGVEKRRSWPVSRVIEELEADGSELQDLLSQLTEDDESRTQEGAPMSLGEFLRLVYEENHDLVHLEQMRSTAEAAR